MSVFDDTYKIEFVCRNCGGSGSLDVPMKTKLEEMPCPHCKCKTLCLRTSKL